jgi:hypothetical protein
MEGRDEKGRFIKGHTMGINDFDDACTNFHKAVGSSRPQLLSATFK